MPKNGSQRSVQVGLLQFTTGVDKQDNIDKALQLAQQAAQQGADIIAFPEMFMLPWFFDDNVDRYSNLADQLESEVWQPFKSVAVEHQVVLACSFFEQTDGNRRHNSVLVIDTDGTIAGIYRKHHLPPNNERIHFIPSDEPFAAIPTNKGCIGVYICWDNFFPEGARALALDGANIVFAPSAATDIEALYKWRIAIQHNALVNNTPWVRINRSEMPFYPHRLVINAAGQIVHETETPQDSVDIVTIDYQDSDRIRQEWPFMQDRRPDLYKTITQP